MDVTGKYATQCIVTPCGKMFPFTDIHNICKTWPQSKLSQWLQKLCKTDIHSIIEQQPSKQENVRVYKFPTQLIETLIAITYWPGEKSEFCSLFLSSIQLKELITFCDRWQIPLFHTRLNLQKAFRHDQEVKNLKLRCIGYIVTCLERKIALVQQFQKPKHIQHAIKKLFHFAQHNVTNVFFEDHTVQENSRVFFKSEIQQLHKDIHGQLQDSSTKHQTYDNESRKLNSKHKNVARNSFSRFLSFQGLTNPEFSHSEDSEDLCSDDSDSKISILKIDDDDIEPLSASSPDISDSDTSVPQQIFEKRLPLPKIKSKKKAISTAKSPRRYTTGEEYVSAMISPVLKELQELSKEYEHIVSDLMITNPKFRNDVSQAFLLKGVITTFTTWECKCHIAHTKEANHIINNWPIPEKIFLCCHTRLKMPKHSNVLRCKKVNGIQMETSFSIN